MTNTTLQEERYRCVCVTYLELYHHLTGTITFSKFFLSSLRRKKFGKEIAWLIFTVT